MKNIKYLVITIVILIIIFGISNFALKNNIDIKDAFIAIENDNFIQIKSDKWSYISDSGISKYEWKKFDVYDNHNYLGNYYLQYNDRWYIFDDEYNSIEYNDSLFAIYGTSNQFYDFSFDNVNESDIIKVHNVLNKLKIIYDVEKIIAKKIYIDVDDDGINEELFVVNNSSTENPDSTMFFLVYLVKNDKEYFLEKTIETSIDEMGMPYYDVRYITKMGAKNNYKFIIYKSYFGSEDINCYSVYEFKNNKIKTLLKAELDYGADNNITNNRDFSLSTIILTISLLGGIVGFVTIMFYLKQKANNEI